MSFPSVLVLSGIGIALSAYAYQVEQTCRSNPDFKPKCELTPDAFSCKKAFMSSYGRTFGQPNGLWGFLFYVLIFLIGMFELLTLLHILAWASVLVSIYLAYVMLFKVKTLCVVCMATYAINVLLLISAYVIAL